MLWFDLDNSPHVPLFRPIIERLKSKGYPYYITARNYAQTKDLLELYNIDYTLIGDYGGKNTIKKLYNLIQRTNLLVKNIKDIPIQLAVNHGSRSQILAAKQRKIKTVTMVDYEYTENYIFNYFSDVILIPIFIPDSRLREAGFNLKKIVRYNGFKEELYLNDFVPQPHFRKELNVRDDDILVVLRPPSITSNYHDKKSETILFATFQYLMQHKNVVCFILSRTMADREMIEKNITLGSNIRFLEKPVDGQQLVYAADVTISGGGTMNRESALLGTDTYSIFSGRKPYLDIYLQQQGRLTFIETCDDVKKIRLEKKEKNKPWKSQRNVPTEVLNLILKQIN